MVAVGYKLQLVVVVAAAVWLSFDVIRHLDSHQCFHKLEYCSNLNVSVEDKFQADTFDFVIHNIVPYQLSH